MPQVDISTLPYRNNVSGIVFKNDKFLLVQRAGWPKNWWKFPQGGIDDGEDNETAMQRELVEELGTDKFKILSQSSYTNKYDWDYNSIEKAGFRWRGQFQKYFLVHYLDEDDIIKINPKEIQSFKWVKRNELLRSIDRQEKVFANYKNTIENVLKEFKKYF